MIQKFAKTKKRGEIIFCEYEPGSTVYFMQTGKVRITKIVSDKEKTLAFIGPGDIFGEMAILEQAPRSATAIVEEDASFLEISKENFSQLVHAQPAMAIKLLKTLAARIQDQNRKYKIISLPDDESKVMDVFLMLAEKEGILAEAGTMEGDTEFEINASEIANWAGIQEETANSILTELEKHHRIKRQGKRIAVINLYHFFRHVLSKRQAMEREGEL